MLHRLIGRNWVICSGWATLGIRTKFVWPHFGGIRSCSKISWIIWIILWPKTCQLVWKKKRMKTVQPRSLQRWEVFKSLKNLIRRGMVDSIWECSRKGLARHTRGALQREWRWYSEVAWKSLGKVSFIWASSGSPVSHKPVVSFKVTTREWLHQWRVVRWKNLVFASP